MIYEKIFTDKEVEKLINCDAKISNEWKSGFKFFRRSRQWAIVLSHYRENQWIAGRRSVTEVRVDGVILSYIGKYEFTNPKKPFKSLNS